jgi:hypothetical protein
MKLLKLIIIFFLIYFVRRFIQMYRALSKHHKASFPSEQDHNPGAQTRRGNKNVVDADFQVLD